MIYLLLIIPFLFGLIGFIEPCSIAANIIFLNHAKELEKNIRIRQAIIFTLVRGLFLASIGLMAAFIGSRFVTIQSSLFITLGSIFIILGILSIVNMYKPIFTTLNFGNWIKTRSPVTLGIIFGLAIPACAIGFVLALVTNAVAMGSLFEGFVSLLVFGITLSSPLIVISWFEESNKIVLTLYQKTIKFKWLGGAVLILVGILTLLSSIWWVRAI